MTHIEPIKFKLARRLQQHLNLAKSLKTNKVFYDRLHSQEFSTGKKIDKIISSLGAVKKSPMVYSISMLTKKEDLLLRYKALKENKFMVNGRRIYVSKFNQENLNSQYLYVGSSMKNIHHRIKQHLGGGSDATYSLHLNKWSFPFNYMIKITVYQLIISEPELLSQQFVELVEQELWDVHAPIFGKRSGR